MSTIPVRPITRATRATTRNASTRSTTTLVKPPPPARSSLRPLAAKQQKENGAPPPERKRKRAVVGDGAAPFKPAAGPRKASAAARPALRSISGQVLIAVTAEAVVEKKALVETLPVPPVAVPLLLPTAAIRPLATVPCCVTPRPADVLVSEPPRALKRPRTSAAFDLAHAVDAPFDEGWEDLDAEDADDPQMVSEYVAEVFEYLKELEMTTLPCPDYMATQPELTWHMRGILTDWLVQVHSMFRLLPETLFLAVNMLDRFLSVRQVSVGKLQLVGVACLFVAAKTEEIVAPSAANYVYCADGGYTEDEIFKAERYVLKTLEWNLSYPNPVHFLRRGSKADGYDVQARTVGKFLLEIACMEWRLVAVAPSMQAAAALWLARLVLGRDGAEWTPNLAHYTSYSEDALLPTASIMLTYVLKPIAHDSFFKKYASRKFMKASCFVQNWALSRWAEGTKVDLEEELPRLRAELETADGGVDVDVL